MKNYKIKIQKSKFPSPTSNVQSPISNLQLPIIFVVVLAIFAILLAAPASAQGPNLDDQVNRIAKGLYCPVCPNTPLDVCDTPACVQWRAQIKEKLLAGESEQQIHDYF